MKTLLKIIFLMLSPSISPPGESELMQRLVSFVHVRPEHRQCAVHRDPPGSRRQAP